MQHWSDFALGGEHLHLHVSGQLSHRKCPPQPHALSRTRGWQTCYCCESQCRMGLHCCHRFLLDAASSFGTGTIDKEPEGLCRSSDCRGREPRHFWWSTAFGQNRHKQVQAVSRASHQLLLPSSEPPPHPFEAIECEGIQRQVHTRRTSSICCTRASCLARESLVSRRRGRGTIFCKGGTIEKGTLQQIATSSRSNSICRLESKDRCRTRCMDRCSVGARVPHQPERYYTVGRPHSKAHSKRCRASEPELGGVAIQLIATLPIRCLHSANKIFPALQASQI